MTVINLKSISGITSITTPAGSDNLFTVHTNNQTERLRIASDGKVGINESSPAVFGVHSSQSSQSVYYRADSGSVDSIFGSATALGYAIAGTTSDHAFTLWANNDERLRIDSTGDVRFAGTNLTNSTNKNVNLTAPSWNTGEEDVNLVQVENEETSNQISFGGGTSGLNASTQLIFRTASAVNTVTGTERLRIDKDGILWVNYGNPVSSSLIILDKDGSGEAALRFYNAASNKAKIALDSSEELTFDVNGDERLRFTSTGQFHMGGGASWTYASQKFVVVEGSNALGMLLQGNNANQGVNLTLQNINNNINAYSDLSFADDGGQIFGAVRGKVVDRDNNHGEIQFHTSAGSLGQRVTINKDGKVGVGIHTLTSQLEIKRANVSGTYPNGNAKPSGASIWNDGGDIFTGRLFWQGSGLSASSDYLTGVNNEGNVLVMYDYSNTKYMQKWHKNAQVELYHNNIKRLSTWSDAVNIYGDQDAAAILHLYADQGDNNDDKWRIRTAAAGSFNIESYATGSWVNNLNITSSGTVSIGGTQFKMYWEDSEDRGYLQGAGEYGIAFRVNNGNRLEISKTTGDVTMQGASGRNFTWDNDDVSLYLTDNGTNSARLKIGSSGDLQMYHDVSNHINFITCATNADLKVSTKSLQVYEYSGVTKKFEVTNDGRVNCTSTSALKVPVGTTAQRPSTLETGQMRYNSTTTELEIYGGSFWFNVKNGISDNVGMIGSAENPAVSGKQLKDLGRSSGNYYIKPKGYSGSAIEAYVDMTTNGGGWVLCGAFALSHSGLTMSGNTSGLNESSVKNYATSVPSNDSSAFYNKNFINYLFHQNATDDFNSTYSIAGVHGRSGNGYILWEVKAQSSHTVATTDAFKTIYKTSDANNNFDVRYLTDSSNTLSHYVGRSSSDFNSYANYNSGRSGTSDGGNNYHYLIDDITGGYEWLFRENSDDNPGNNNGYDISIFFIR